MSWRDVALDEVLLQGAAERVGGEDVVAHRREDLRRVLRRALGDAGLLLERGDAARVVELDDAELRRLLGGHGDGRHGHRRPRLDMGVEHLAGVDAVDVVGAEHEHVRRLLVVEQVHVLVQGVGGPEEPAGTAPHLGRHRRDVVAERRRQPPRQGDVDVEAVALVLGQHDDLAVVAVDQVGEDEVDQPVVTPERHGRLRPVGGQRHQPLALPAGEDDRQDTGLVLQGHASHCAQRRHGAASGSQRPGAGRGRTACPGRDLNPHALASSGF